jgi:hypothetical protein
VRRLLLLGDKASSGSDLVHLLLQHLHLSHLGHLKSRGKRTIISLRVRRYQKIASIVQQLSSSLTRESTTLLGQRRASLRPDKKGRPTHHHLLHPHTRSHHAHPPHPSHHSSRHSSAHHHLLLLLPASSVPLPARTPSILMRHRGGECGGSRKRGVHGGGVVGEGVNSGLEGVLVLLLLASWKQQTQEISVSFDND